MKKLLFSAIFGLFSLSMALAQTTTKSLIGAWQFERVEILTGDATLSEADQELKQNAEKALSTELQGKNISFSAKTCNDNLFGLGNVKWKFYKDDQQLQLIREVMDGKDKLKEIKSYKATIENEKLLLEDYTLPKYRIYMTRKP